MRIAFVFLLAGCGRLGFDEALGENATPDAPVFGSPSGDGGTTAVVGRVSCLGVQQEGDAASGVKTFDPDGAGPLGDVTAYCDMTSDGGGWTLVMSYVHKAGTNPPLQVRTTDLPKLGSDTLGTDEGGTEFWGHAGHALLSKLPFNELRWTCRSSTHTRVVDFRTVASTCLTYARTGVGFCGGVKSEYIPLAGATGMLPLQATHVIGDAGDFALTHDPLFKNTQPKGNMIADSSTATWACDEQAQGTTSDTIFRAWVR